MPGQFGEDAAGAGMILSAMLGLIPSTRSIQNG